MLQNLSIQDFILIEKLDLDFKDGFSVITGQTGAGKSILLTAILFALGAKIGISKANNAKSDSDLVRAGQEKAIVTLTFSVDEASLALINQYFNNHALEADSLEFDGNNELIIKRIQYSNGRRKFLINDQLVTQKVVFELFDYLLEIHGQHNHTLLLDSSSHLEILDGFADNAVLKAQVADLYKIWRGLEQELKLANSERDKLAQEVDYLTHIIKEFKDINLKSGEEEELAAVKKQIQISDKETQLIKGILQDISSSNLEQIIIRAGRSITKSENVNNYSQISLYLDEIYNKTEELKSALSDVLNSFDFGGYALSEVEDRLYSIRSLARKHGCHTNDLPGFIEDSEQKLAILIAKLTSCSYLQEKIDATKQEYLIAAEKLSHTRKIAAKELEEKTMQELTMLDMKKAVFLVTLEQDGSSSTGTDQVRFLATTNPGVLPAPIDKIASGGELSRFMLAFRAAFSGKFTKQTIIFDEVDVGISGHVADSIGQRLKNLSKTMQVIVITHQPQVAGKADEHILVQKFQSDDTTKVTITKLDQKGRTAEIARMISGQEITHKAMEAAKELISF